MGKNPFTKTAVGAQSKGRLIVVLYGSAIKFLKLAIKELKAQNYASMGQYINWTLDIINGLDSVLDTQDGGESRPTRGSCTTS